MCVGVAEVENIGCLKDLCAELKKKHNRTYEPILLEGPDRRGVDVGFLYNPEMFKVTNTKGYTLNAHYADGGRVRSRFELLISGYIIGAGSPEKIHVIVNHWPSRYGGELSSRATRDTAAMLCRSICDSLYKKEPRAKIVVMGDLNDDPQNKSCCEALGAKKEIKDCVEPGSCFNPWWNILNKGIGTLGYKGNWNLFDQIIFTDYFLKNYDGKDKPTLTFSRAEVLNRKFLRSNEGDRQGYPLRTFSGGVFLNGYSDHFPTMIYLVKEVK